MKEKSKKVVCSTTLVWAPNIARAFKLQVKPPNSAAAILDYKIKY